jgi:hypothetical protein
MVNSQLLIKGNGELTKKDQHPAAIRFFAHLVSYLFHPLFIPLYAAWFLAFIHPGCFAGFSEKQKIWILVRIAYTMVFFPIVTVLLLKLLGFNSSIYLKTQKERIIPYIACGIFFFWAYLVFKNQPEIPVTLTAFTFGVFLSSSVALLANIRMKISMHAIGMGGLLGLFLIIMFQSSMLMTVPLCIVFLLMGIVCTSRMVVSDHTPKEIYLGLFLGLFCQFAAAFIVG